VCRQSEDLIVRKSDSSTANPNPISNPNPNYNPGMLSDFWTIGPSDYQAVTHSRL